MKYLLDTHIILWALINDSRLDESIRLYIITIIQYIIALHQYEK